MSASASELARAHHLDKPHRSTFGTASMPSPRRATSLLSSFSGKLCRSLAVSFVVISTGLQSLVVKVRIRARFMHGRY
jgi:type IV secretory pathway VirB2 component (pilin)